MKLLQIFLLVSSLLFWQLNDIPRSYALETTDVVTGSPVETGAALNQAGQEIRQNASNLSGSSSDRGMGVISNTGNQTTGSTDNKLDEKTTLGADENKADFANLFVQNLALIVIALTAGSLIVICPTTRVVSVDIFVASSIAWIVAEIAFYASYSMFSLKGLKEFNEAEHSGEGKDVQIEALKTLQANADKLANLFTAQLAVYATLTAGFAAATAASVGEAYLLKTVKAKLEAIDAQNIAAIENYDLALGKLIALRTNMLVNDGKTMASGLPATAAASSSKVPDKQMAMNKLNADKACKAEDLQYMSTNTTALTASLAADISARAAEKQETANNAADAALEQAEYALAAASGGLLLAKEQVEQVQIITKIPLVEASKQELEAARIAKQSAGELKDKTGKVAVGIKNNVLYDCHGVEPLGCAKPNALVFSPEKNIFNLFNPFIPKALAEDNTSESAPIIGGSGGSTQGILFFVDAAVMGVLLYVVYKFKMTLRQFIVHPIKRAILFGVCTAIATANVALVASTRDKIIARKNDYGKILARIKARPDNAYPKTNTSGASGSSHNQSAPSTYSSSGALDPFNSFSSSGAYDIQSDKLNGLNGKNCVSRDKQNPLAIGGLDKNCDCLATNSCYSIPEVKSPDTMKLVVGTQDQILFDSIKLIGNNLSQGQLVGAANLANSSTLRQASKEAIRKSSNHKDNLNKIALSGKYGDLSQSIDKFRDDIVDKIKKPMQEKLKEDKKALPTVSVSSLETPFANFDDKMAKDLGKIAEAPNSIGGTGTGNGTANDSSKGKTSKTSEEDEDLLGFGDLNLANLSDMADKSVLNENFFENKPEFNQETIIGSPANPNSNTDTGASIFEIVSYRYKKKFGKKSETK